jgi:hypothetical protein
VHYSIVCTNLLILNIPACIDTIGVAFDGVHIKNMYIEDGENTLRIGRSSSRYIIFGKKYQCSIRCNTQKINIGNYVTSIPNNAFNYALTQYLLRFKIQYRLFHRIFMRHRFHTLPPIYMFQTNSVYTYRAAMHWKNFRRITAIGETPSTVTWN